MTKETRLLIKKCEERAIKAIKALGLEPKKYDLKISGSMVYILGQCTFRPNRDPQYTITLRREILAHEVVLQGVIAHEILHTCKNMLNHGGPFMDAASRLNRVGIYAGVTWNGNYVLDEYTRFAICKCGYWVSYQSNKPVSHKCTICKRLIRTNGNYARTLDHELETVKFEMIDDITQ